MNKLEKTKTLLSKLKCLTELKNYGFVNKIRYGYPYRLWINEKDKIVVKQSYFATTKIPKRAIKTLFYKIKEQNSHQSKIKVAIQPLADISKKTITKADNFFDRNPKLIHKGFVDYHPGNIAKYRNKYVLIDW